MVGFPVDEFGWVTRQFMTVVIREKVCSVMIESGSSFTGVEEPLGGLLLWKNMIFEYR